MMSDTEATLTSGHIDNLDAARVTECDSIATPVSRKDINFISRKDIPVSGRDINQPSSKNEERKDRTE